MSEVAPLLLRVEVPICAFRPFASREYQDTYPVPTPASAYGMLLSFLGIERENKARHAGVRMALALSPRWERADSVDNALPWRSSVFRKLRRVSQYGYNKTRAGRERDLFVLSARRPDYQDLLTDVTLWVWLEKGEDAADPPLPKALAGALDAPAIVSRHGGLSLGESSYLVNRLNVVARGHVPRKVIVIRPDKEGFYSLPVWTDHEHDRSRSERFRLELASPEPPGWFTVAPE
jgi:CRISPR-associated protein Cas5t